MTRNFFFAAFVLGAIIAGAPDARAAKVKGYRLPDRLASESGDLVLNGIALKEVSIFSVDVYVVGLYVMKPSRDWKQILTSADPKLVRFRFTHDVRREALVDSWLADLGESCGGRCKDLLARVRRVGRGLPDIRSGQVMDYRFDEEGVSILIDGCKVASLPGSSDARAILAALIGDEAPSQELRQALLGAGRS